jgi:TatA/E family protein of Tat protein translocase
MFDIGLQELVLIFVIALLVFGPKNLPQLGRSLGRAMREFRKASDEFRSTIETNLHINEPDPPTLHPASEPISSDAPVAVTSATDPLPDTALDPHAPSDTAPAAVEPPPGEAYFGQRGARLFHSRDCGWAKKIAEPERVYFKRLAEAREAGFVGCPVCDPWEPA